MNSSTSQKQDSRQLLPKDKGLIKFLRGPLFAVICILLVLLTNLRHAVSVYAEITDSSMTLWSFEFTYIIAMMLAIDFAVIAFSVNGNKPAAKVFAIAIGLINLFFYFSKIGLPESWVNPNCTDCLPNYLIWIKYAPATILSSLSGYAIYYFNEIFIKNIEWDNYLKSLQSEVEEWREKYHNLKNQQIKASQEMVDDLEKQKSLTIDLLDWISEQQNYAGAKTNTLHKRRSRAKEKLTKSTTDGEKLKAKLEMLAIDHHLENRNNLVQSHLNGQESY